MATLVKTDSSVSEVSPKDGKVFDLLELRSLIGIDPGQSIEIVPLVKEQRLMVCDEDGHYNKLDYNPLANLKYKDQVNGTIVGDVLICTIEELQEEEEEEIE